MVFRIFETEPFKRDLGRLDRSVRARLELKMRNQVYGALRQSPRLDVLYAVVTGQPIDLYQSSTRPV